MKKKTWSERQKDDVRVLIAEAKIKNNFDDDELSRYLGIGDRTLRDRKIDPGASTLDKILILLELTGKEANYVKRIS